MTGKYVARAIIFILILISLTACASGATGSQTTPTFEGAQPVDRQFSALYQGMADAIGPAISPKFERTGVECQYTLNALMCFDPSRAEDSQFYLAPLGSALEFTWSELPKTDTALNIEGVPTQPEFYAYLYKYFKGTRFAGKPISPVIYNYQEQRVEQFFENMLLYHHFSDPIDEVHLMSLGHADCWQTQPEQCPYRPELDDPINDLVGSIETPYGSVLAGLGDLNDFGRVLTPPYLTSDGRMEQIWENVVFTWPVDHPEQAYLFPLADWMRMPGTIPGPQLYDLSDGIIFFEVKDGLGFHIPLVFDEFGAQHDGQALSGPPTGDYMLTEDGTAIRQCFVNYCLIFDLNPAIPNDLRVRLLPLGVAYRDQYYTAPEAPPEAPLNLANATLTIRETRPEVTLAGTQVIEAGVVDAGSGRPLPDLQVRVQVKLPDGSLLETFSPVTDADGYTSIEIPPQPGFQHGLVVGYQACLLIPEAEPVCQYGSYLIWDLK